MKGSFSWVPVQGRGRRGRSDIAVEISLSSFGAPQNGGPRIHNQGRACLLPVCIDQAEVIAFAAASISIQFTPHIWPSRSSKLRPYMKSNSSFGDGSGAPPAAVALPTRSSTSARLSAVTQSSTWLDVLASTIFFEVNCRYLSWVISIAWMVSENTMQDAVSSENCW